MKKTIIVFCINILLFNLNAQTVEKDTILTKKIQSRAMDLEHFDMPKVIPISPEAASLGMYGEIPIGHYTGTANISIPLYEIDLDGKKFPINISYHPSGIKVTQESSTIGLGWALQFGGTIVRDVRGWDDFDNGQGYVSGYYFDETFPEDDGMNNPKLEYVREKYINYRGYINSKKDSEPDIFHFNFPGNSGSFFFKKIGIDKNTKKYAYPVIQNVSSNLQIEYNIESKTWTVIDGDGYKYYFNTKEKTSFYDTSAASIGLFDADYLKKDHLFQSRYPEPEVITAWCLDSIISPKNNKLTINYEKDGVSSLINTSESVYHILDYSISPKIQESDFIPSYDTPYYSYSFGEIDQARPVQIETNNIRVEFEHENRKDLEPLTRKSQWESLNNPQRITGILIYDNGKLIKKIELNQSYSGDTKSFKTCRLRLDDIIEYSPSNTQGLKYSFKYKSVNLPNKYSNMHDDWGYYNAEKSSSNVFGDVKKLDLKLTTHIPEYTYTDKYDRDVTLYGRKKKVVTKYTEAESLSTIKYPTGGSVFFYYEPHILGYSDLSSVETEEKYLAQVNMRNYVPDPYDHPEDVPLTEVYSQDFEIKEKTDVFFSYWFNIANKKDGYDDTQVFNCIRLMKGSQVIKTFSFGGGNGYGINKEKIKNLLPGKYTLEIVKGCPYSPHDFNLSASITYIDLKEIITKNKALGGGLRIKSIKYQDDDGKVVKERSYDYAYAIVMAVPKFHKKENIHFTTSQSVLSPDGKSSWLITYDINYTFLISKANPITPFSSSAQGNPFGYNWVLETFKEIDEEGKLQTLRKEKYFYNCVSDEFDNELPYSDDKSTIDGLRGKPFLGNGLLVQKEIYNASDLQIKTEYEYEETVNASVKGFITQQNPFVIKNQPDDNFKSIKLKYYEIPSSYWSLKKEITIKYVGDDTFSGMDETEYTYNKTNFLPSSIVSENSKGQKTETKLRYAFESDKLASKMKQKNLVNKISEQISLIDNKVVSGNKIEYGEFTGEMFLPNSYSSLKIESPISEQSYTSTYKEDFAITQYDKKGNIVEIKEKDGSYTSFLWSYNYQYPIVEIKHCRYSILQNAIENAYKGQGGIDFISKKTDLSNSFVKGITDHVKKVSDGYISYFTYKSGIGILTSTDPRGFTTYYSYDSLGRLVDIYLIENNSKKILKSYNYNLINK